MFLDIIYNSIFQVLLALFIPFLAFLISRRNITGFPKYVGIYLTSWRDISIGVSVGVLMALTVFIQLKFDSLRNLMYAPSNPAMKFREMGLSVPSVLALLIYANIATGFSEELLFRGFFAKRFIQWLGFQWGNMMQALLFGVFHFLIFRFLNITRDFPTLLFVVVFTTLISWFWGFLNEKIGNGSILPSWFSHGIGNSISYAIIAYL